MKAVPAPLLLLPVAAFGLLAACAPTGEGTLGPPDGYLLFGLDSPAPSAAGRFPTVRKLPLDEGVALELGRLFADGFGAEMVRTVHLAKQLVRNGIFDGKRFADEARTAAGDPLCLVVGIDQDAPFARGLTFPRWLLGPAERPGTVWLGLPAGLEDDKALVQTVTGRLAAHVAQWVGTAGRLDAAPPPSSTLAEGYRMAMEVIAREWRVVKGPRGNVAPDAGTPDQRRLFADVREGRLILTPDGSALRPPAELLTDAGVAATVLYRLAQTRSVAQRVAPAAAYQPFVAGPLPEGVTGAAVLGPFRNFQAKLLQAWARAVMEGRPPVDLVDMLESYGGQFPDERAEVLRVFLATTFAGTVEPGGLSRRPEDAPQTVAALAALGEEIAAGRRTLRDALKRRDGTPPEAPLAPGTARKSE
jgi:hypothetical protein